MSHLVISSFLKERYTKIEIISPAAMQSGGKFRPQRSASVAPLELLFDLSASCGFCSS